MTDKLLVTRDGAVTTIAINRPSLRNAVDAETMGMLGGAILGSLDQDHHAWFQPGADGLRLVLHHEGNCAQHEHHGVARALTIFAQPASATDPDHVLQFASGDCVRSESAKVISGAAASTTAHFAFTAPLTGQSSRIEFKRPTIGARPNPVARLLHLRSTVLLI